MENYKVMDDTYVAHTYARFPLCITKGEGSHVFDDEGKEYIDFTSGIGVNSLGYADQEWVEAVQKQAATIAHISNLYYTEPMLEAAKTICEKANMKRVFFANSGAEANEGIIKVCRKYAATKYGPQRNKIITLVNSFHGRTIATLQATGQDVFHQNFGPFPEGFTYANANDMASVLAQVDENTAGIMFEIVQGEGGVIPLDATFLNDIQKLCDEKDILLLIDEVQTGIGRTGSFFAYQQFGLHPDLVSSAKGLGGGLPIGAVIMNEKTQDVLVYGDHGTTFGANPIVSAGMNVVLNRMSEEFLANVKANGEYIRSRLEKMPRVIKVNGLGMMLGVVLDDIPSKDLVNACIDKGVLFLTAKANLRLLPPLTISREDIDQGLDILEDVLTNWK